MTASDSKPPRRDPRRNAGAKFDFGDKIGAQHAVAKKPLARLAAGEGDR